MAVTNHGAMLRGQTALKTIQPTIKAESQFWL